MLISLLETYAKTEKRHAFAQGDPERRLQAAGNLCRDCRWGTDSLCRRFHLAILSTSAIGCDHWDSARNAIGAPPLRPRAPGKGESAGTDQDAATVILERAKGMP